MLADVTTQQAWTNMQFLGNTVWQWLALLGVLIGSMIVGRIVAFILQRQARQLGKFGRLRFLATVLESMSAPAALLILAIGLYIASGFMDLSYVYREPVIKDGTLVESGKTILDFWLKVCRMIVALSAGWFLFRLVEVVEVLLKHWVSRTRSELDDQLVPMIRKALRLFVAIVVFLFIAQNIFEWNIGALIAGLGIGGLAIALAAQSALSNLFGSIIIFTDRPFAVGDRIVIRGVDGTVEEVGFRSTKIRTLAGHLVTMPNSVIGSEAVENIGRRPSIRRILDVTVTYDTPAEKVQRGVQIIREMLDARKGNFPEAFPPRVYFSDFNAASLNIAVYYWFTPPDWWAYLEFTHDFNMELLRRFNDEGIEFAFPTQTLYLKKHASDAGAAEV